MEPLQFKEIRELLNACHLTTLEGTPTSSEKGYWELYKGKYQAHVVDVPFEVLYIHADATRESIRNAKKYFKPKETQVVYAPSSKIKGALKTEFAGTARGFWSTTEYLASFMRKELDAYRQALKKLNPSFYLEPPVESPAGTIHKLPNPLQLFLSDPETSAEQQGVGSIGVVLAEAGHGKTHMCHWLVAKLATDNFSVLPIFVSSTQWQRLRPEDLSSLGTTIVSSFRELGTPIPWVEGQEQLFLKIGLKAGLFRIVFDGFDEYMLKMPGDVEATETLSAISTLASETGTRVILTSRTSFWESEFPTDANTSAPQSTTNVFVYRLKPFDLNFAREFFKQSFNGDSSKINKASTIFNELSKTDADFAGRGFVLVLITDLVNFGQELGEVEKPIIRLMRAHCERERKRQQLQLTAQQQLETLKDFVFEVTQGAVPNSDLVTTAIQLAAPELTYEETQICLKRMTPHALIDGAVVDQWKIRQPQVETALLAMKLMDIAEKDKDGISLLKNFSNKKLDPSNESDLASMITSLCLWNKQEDEGITAIQKLISTFFHVSTAPLDHLQKNSLRRLSTSIALRAIDMLAPKFTHKERANLLQKLFPTEHYRGVVFFGGLARFDWSGSIFEDCVFDNVRWSNCRFDSNTSFRRCHLFGGNEHFCDGFENAIWNNTRADDLGRQFLERTEVRSGKKSYSEEHLKRDLSTVIEKFVGKGNVGFRSLNSADLKKGKISSSPHKDTIIKLVRNHLLEEHHISGNSNMGLALKEEAKESVRILLANNAWTGKLAQLLDDAKKELKITVH